MIKVNGNIVVVKGDSDIVEKEVLFLLSSLYNSAPKSLYRILQSTMDYMDGTLVLISREVEDD